MSRFDGIPAGVELDRLVAERVMSLHLDWHHSEIQAIVAEPASVASNEGRGIYCRCAGCDRHGFGNFVDWAARCPSPVAPPYSTDLATAWQVVEGLRAREYAWQFAVPHEGVDMSAIVFHFTPRTWHVERRAATMPLAICRAALAIVDEIALNEMTQIAQEMGAYD